MKVLVTGANSGIGYATALGLAKTGATVILACRNRNRDRGKAAVAEIVASTGNENLHLMICDLSSQESIRGLAEDVQTKFSSLDVLINNAAIFAPTRVESVDGIELQIATNYLGTFLLTNLLLDRLNAGKASRIINISTANHFFATLELEDLQSKVNYEPKTAHIQSKLAIVFFTFELAARLAEVNTTVNCLCPGVTATNLLGQFRNIPVEERFSPQMGGAPLEEGARTPLYLALSSDVNGISGQYFENCKSVASSPESHDKDKAVALWRASERLVARPG